MKRQEKAATIKTLEESFGRQDTIYLLDYTGMKVSQAVELRRLLRKNAYEFKVIKNRLALRALADDMPSALRGYFEKPTALALAAAEPVRLARLLKDFSTQHKVLSFKGGLIEGRLLPPERFEEVCRLPARAELLARVGFLTAFPLTQLLRMWQAPLMQIGRLLNQLKDKK